MKTRLLLIVVLFVMSAGLLINTQPAKALDPSYWIKFSFSGLSCSPTQFTFTETITYNWPTNFDYIVFFYYTDATHPTDTAFPPYAWASGVTQSAGSGGPVWATTQTVAAPGTTPYTLHQHIDYKQAVPTGYLSGPTVDQADLYFKCDVGNVATAWGADMNAPKAGTGGSAGPDVPAGFVLARVTCDVAVFDSPGGQPVGENRIRNGQTWFVNPLPATDTNGEVWTEIFVKGWKNGFIPSYCVNRRHITSSGVILKYATGKGTCDANGFNIPATVQQKMPFNAQFRDIEKLNGGIRDVFYFDVDKGNYSGYIPPFKREFKPALTLPYTFEYNFYVMEKDTTSVQYYAGIKVTCTDKGPVVKTTSKDVSH